MMHATPCVRCFTFLNFEWARFVSVYVSGIGMSAVAVAAPAPAAAASSGDGGGGGVASSSLSAAAAPHIFHNLRAYFVAVPPPVVDIWKKLGPYRAALHCTASYQAVTVLTGDIVCAAQAV